MKMKCERDDTIFDAVPQPYPLPEKQSGHYDPVNGDQYIQCPTCGRRYFFYNGGENTVGRENQNGHWYADRRLIPVVFKNQVKISSDEDSQPLKDS